MDESSLLELLQIHGQSNETGALTCVDGERRATIYLFDGEVVYAESGQDSGLAAIFIAMSWPTSHATWTPGKTPPKIMFRHEYDSLIFQFAQMEDAGETDENAIRATFSEELSSSASKQVKMLDLNNYVISFEVLNSDFKGFIFYLEKGVSLIGRLEDCDIILPDASVSSHHCKLVQDANCIRVIDLGSTNGSRINGELITEGLLQVGDTFQIGAVEVCLNVKLKRNLDQAIVQQKNSSIAQASMNHTAKLELQKNTKSTSKITGPITWKNLSVEQEEKQSLFSKVFGKKNQ
ncbi:MAG: FHA domain-containing protein [Verrucomicrobiota bacterium]